MIWGQPFSRNISMFEIPKCLKIMLLDHASSTTTIHSVCCTSCCRRITCCMYPVQTNILYSRFRLLFYDMNVGPLQSPRGLKPSFQSRLYAMMRYSRDAINIYLRNHYSTTAFRYNGVHHENRKTRGVADFGSVCDEEVFLCTIWKMERSLNVLPLITKNILKPSLFVEKIILGCYTQQQLWCTPRS